MINRTLIGFFLTRLSALGTGLFLIMFLSVIARSQSIGLERDRSRAMLNKIKIDIKKHYYDPNFHGIDLEKRFKEADEKMKTATSAGQLFGIIAQVLVDFNDSHTFFIPPSRASRTEYGWQMQMIGNKCYVSAIKPDSDAEAKGLKVGDEIYSIDGIEPTRENIWKLQYFYYALRPRAGMRVILQRAGNQLQELDVMAKVHPGRQHIEFSSVFIADLIRAEENENRLNRQRYIEVGDDLLIWKMPMFDMEDSKMDEMMDKARKRKSLILDLRGNPGGYEITLQRLMGYFFDREIKIGELKEREKTKPLMAKPHGKDVFKGKLVILVDSRSASSAEIFARMIQLEKRGTVIGDHTAGAVMRAIQQSDSVGADIQVFYALSVTTADLIMSDGKSLEHVGVTPDELVLSSGTDLATNRDPALSRAAEMLGVKLDPEKAGTFFPIEWRK